jgi:hypothetical protein
MGLLDDIRDETNRRNTLCAVGQWLQHQTPDDFDQLEIAFADPTITTAAIQRVLKRHGFANGWTTVHRHRTGACACGNR